MNEPHISGRSVGAGLARSASGGQPPSRDHRQPVADLEQLVELFRDDEDARRRRRADRAAPGGSARAAPTSTPQVGCAAIITCGRCRISRPTMNFCRLPPDRLRAAASAPPALRRRSRDRSPAHNARTTPQRMKPRRTMPWRCAVSSALSASDISGTARRGRGAPRARTRARARAAAAASRRPAGRRSGSMTAGVAQRRSPESAASSSFCPLPDTPAMPTISPAANRAGRCPCRSTPKGSSRAQREAAHDQRAIAARARLAVPRMRQVAADHHAARGVDESPVVGSHSPVTRPAAQDRRAVAQRADLVRACG